MSEALLSVCYSLAASERDWLLDLTRTLAPLLDHGFGVGAVPFRFSEKRELQTIPACGLDAELAQFMFDLGTSAPSRFGTQFFIGPRRGSACERIRYAGGLNRHPIFRGFHLYGIRDIDALTVHDRAGFGLALIAPAPRVLQTSRPALRRLARVREHLLAGLRLRRSLGNLEAVLDGAGRVHDAEGEARSREQRQTLRDAVKAFERMRTDARKSELGFDAFEGLINGQWSLVETFDSDGRRFLLARRNRSARPAALRRAGLTAPEKRAITLRGRGGSYKVVAAELESSVASAHRLVRTALRKLGMKDEAELPQLLAACAELTRGPI